MKFTSDPDLADWLIDFLFLYLSDVQEAVGNGDTDAVRRSVESAAIALWVSHFQRGGQKV